MPETLPYGKRDYYPHMMPEDVAVWERYIAANPDAFDTCEYDFPVGKIPEFVANGTPEDHASMERLYKKKIDVVARKTNDIYIIELKPQCSSSTIGQVKGYAFLYGRDVKPETTPRVIVICGGASDDVLEHAAAEGVKVIVV
jgi:hypothetical protein